MKNAVHWADIYAEKIIREKGEKDLYVCASGITPSGTVHIGNFREIISVDLVVRALREKGKNVRFIYSWDDFDVFRKVPANMPNKEELTGYLRFPITQVPDPAGKAESFARANELRIESVLNGMGIHPEYIYQAAMYENSAYADGLKKALEKTQVIKAILNEYRSKPLEDSWLPVSVFCESCHKDTTNVRSWNGEWHLSYSCDSCGFEDTVDLRKTSVVKLPWRVDWPMRWEYEGVDFEPAGKEHHSSGGSFDTAKSVVKAVYETDPPVTFKYDFISIKGMGGKISSSKGNVISIDEVLEVYPPEIVRYLFAGTKPDSEFAISFDLDVLKIYEDYDRCERVYFGLEEVSEKRAQKDKRTYELSQIAGVPPEIPPQLPLRHLCNLLQIHNGDIDAALEMAAKEVGIRKGAGSPDGVNRPDDESIERLRVRAVCAWNWITTYAPEGFRFTLREPGGAAVPVDGKERAAVVLLRGELEREKGNLTEESIGTLFYSIAEKAGLETKQFFTLIYKILLGKERGPRLANFILTVGEERVVSLLEPY